MERASGAGTTIKEEAAFHFRVETNLPGDGEAEIMARNDYGKSQTHGCLPKAGVQTRDSLELFKQNCISRALTLSELGTWIPLPSSLKNKKAIVNMETHMTNALNGQSREL